MVVKLKPSTNLGEVIVVGNQLSKVKNSAFNATAINTRELTNTTNVIDFLRGRDKGAQPERLRESEVMRMLGTADELVEPTEDDENEFIVGETVKINEGAFIGFSGVIQEVNKERRKLKVMVKIFGRKTPLELENSQVERE